MYVKEWMVCTSTTFKSRPLFVENRFFRFHSIEWYVQYEIAGADFDLFFYLVAPFFTLSHADLLQLLETRGGTVFKY